MEVGSSQSFGGVSLPLAPCDCRDGVLLAQQETPQGLDGGRKDLPSLWRWLQKVGRNHRMLQEVVPTVGTTGLGV